MRVMVGAIDAAFHDIDSLLAEDRVAVLAPDSYVASRALGHQLREDGSDGVVYPSVRNAGGACVGAFRPTAIGISVQGDNLADHWDGARINRVFDYDSRVWHDVWGRRPMAITLRGL